MGSLSGVAHVPIPQYQDLFLPTLQAIEKLGGSGTKDEIDDLAVELAGLTADQVAVQFPDDAQQKGSKVIHRLAWARSYLKKMGAVNNSKRGVWTLEAPGKAYLGMSSSEAAEQLQEQDKAIRHEYSVKSMLKKKKLSEASESSDVALMLDDAVEEGAELESDGWKDELIKILLSVTPAAFERLAQRLLREAGFKNVEVVGKSGDGGIDGIGVYRPSLVSFPIYFQCKGYEKSVGAGHVRDFRGAMAGRGEKGLLITTGTFTAEAKKEATRDGAPPVELIDGDGLCDLLKEYGVGVLTETVELVKPQSSFFAAL